MTKWNERVQFRDLLELYDDNAEDESEIYNMLKKLRLIKSCNPFHFFKIISNIKNQKVLIMILEVCK